MNANFFKELLNKQDNKQLVPSNKVIITWTLDVLHLLYPEMSDGFYTSADEVKARFDTLEKELVALLVSMGADCNCTCLNVAKSFFNGIPEIYRLLNTDIYSIYQGDPAAKNEFEVVRTYPGFYAISFYRIAHGLFKLDVPLLPRIITEYAHSRTGIDIHPGAVIGEYFFIDHGTGIVVGETANIGHHVKLYQGVTLGALSVDKSMAWIKRHPTIEDHVVIYSGATVLGGETIVGHHSIVGGSVWLTKSIPPGTLVYHNPEVTVVEGKIVSY